MLKAFKVETHEYYNDDSGKRCTRIKEEFFPGYMRAWGFASRKSNSLDCGITILYENSGGETYVEIERFERNPNYIPETVAASSPGGSRRPSAVGNTSEKRWSNAIRNEAVPIIRRVYK